MNLALHWLYVTSGPGRRIADAWAAGFDFWAAFMDVNYPSIEARRN